MAPAARPLLGLPGWASAALAAVVAVVLPAVYSRSLAADHARRVAELDARSQYRRAQRLRAGMPDAAPDAALDRKVAGLERAVRQPLPAGAPPAAMVQRAQMLAALDRLDDSRRLVSPLAAAHPDGALHLAALDYEQGRRAESDAGYRGVLERAGRMKPSDRVSLWRVQAYEGLAANARRDKDLAGAVAAFQEAMAALPEAEAYLNVQLGRQLLEAGRPVAALRHLRAAADREPHHYEAVVRPLIREALQGSFGCFVRR